MVATTQLMLRELFNKSHERVKPLETVGERDTKSRSWREIMESRVWTQPWRNLEHGGWVQNRDVCPSWLLRTKVMMVQSPFGEVHYRLSGGDLNNQQMSEGTKCSRQEKHNHVNLLR